MPATGFCDRMIQLRETIQIDRPPAEAFPLVAAFENVAEWDPGVLWARRRPPAPLGLGSGFDLELGVGGRRIPMRYTLSAWEPPRFVELSGQGDGFTARDRIELQAHAGGTRLSYAADIELAPGNPATRFQPLLAVLLRRGGRRAIARLGEALARRPACPRAGFWERLADVAVLPGLVGFSRLGYRWRRRGWPPLVADLRGRRIVVTGATSGLGLAAATRLAALGAAVVGVGRDPAKAERARRAILQACPGAEVHFEVADLSLMDEVRDLGIRLRDGQAPIHVLINNAGALFPDRQETRERLERCLAVNLLGPFLLTQLLLPRLQASAPARIVNVSSGGMYAQRLWVDDLAFRRAPYAGPTAYARAKRALTVLGGLWARRLQGTGVVVHTMHPGWADTPGLGRSLPGFQRLTQRWLRSASEGADTMVWLAAAPQAAGCSGWFWMDRRPRPTHLVPWTREKPAERERLWEEVSRLSGWHPGGDAAHTH